MTWKRTVFRAAAACALALAGSAALGRAARAEVRIASDCRVVNLPPGRCGWCAVETLARHHGIKVLYGLADDHPADASALELAGALQAAGVRYRMQSAGSSDTTILSWASRAGLGAAVGLRPLRPGLAGHVVTLTHFGSEDVRLIDPDDQDRRVRTVPREHFLHFWDGFALVLGK
jgi:hypothetical protein